MPTKAREVRSNPNGDRRLCATCNPGTRIRYDACVRFFERHGYWPMKP